MKKIIFILNIVLFVTILRLNTDTVLASTTNNKEDVNVEIGKSADGYMQGGTSNTFIIKSTKSGKLNITIDCYAKDTISASLYSDINANNPNEIGGTYNEAKGYSTITYEVLVSPRTYYLKLTSPFVINNGNIHVATQFEEMDAIDSGYRNNSNSSAIALKNDSYYRGILAFDETDDYYALDVKNKQFLKVAVTSKSKDTAIVLVKNANGEELAKEYIYEGRKFNFNEQLPAGKYYLLISKGSQILHSGKRYVISTGKYQRIRKVTIPNSKTIYVNDSYNIKPQITPKSAIEKYTFSSSNKNIAKVSENGKVKALKKGTAIITLVTDEGKIKKTCKITVKEVAAKSIRLNRTNASLKEGESIALSASILPYNTTKKKVYWNSSNKNVASVSSSGKVTAQGAGTCNITARISGISTSCSIKVTAKQTIKENPKPTPKPTPEPTPNPTPNKPPKKDTIEVKSISILSSINIYLGKTKSIKDLLATVTPDNASNKTLSWSSTDSSIVVIKGGAIIPKKVGTARIVVSSNNGKKAYCTVVVKEN